MEFTRENTYNFEKTVELRQEKGLPNGVNRKSANIYSEKIEKYSKNLLTFAYKCGIIPTMKRVEAGCADIRLG